jgi:hypothetical protein
MSLTEEPLLQVCLCLADTWEQGREGARCYSREVLMINIE